MKKQEAIQRLEAINERIQRVLASNQPLLHDTYKLLNQLVAITQGEEEPVAPPAKHEYKLDHIIISCDASITKNPGGQAAVGVVIQFPNTIEKYADLAETPLECYRKTKSKSNNQAEYDAIYFGLTSLFNLHNNPGCEVEVRSDSKLVIDQINDKMACKDEKLKAKRNNIYELLYHLPVIVRFEWRPRNSTPELELANFLAQDVLGVKRH